MQARLASCPETTAEKKKNPPPQKTLLSRPMLGLVLADVDCDFAMDDKVFELMEAIAETFVREVVEGAYKLSRHRRSDVVSAADARAYLGVGEYSRVKRMRRPAKS